MIFFVLKVFLMLMLFNNALTLELQTGVIFKGRATNSNAKHDAAYPKISSIINKNQGRRGLAIGDANLGTGSNWYRLFRNLTLYGVDVQNYKILGIWPLTPPNFPCEEPINCNTTWNLVRWNKDEALETEVIKRYHNYGVSIQPYRDSNASSLGCLGNAPLKYGDIDGDNQPELVLYIGNSWMVFSTQLNKVIFMSMLDVDDWMSETRTRQHFAYHREEGALPKPKDPQYQSKVAASIRGGDHANEPAYRGYAKLYFGDFNNDKAADIIVWRKLYRSKLVEDNVKGFTKVSDMFVLFSLNKGEYKRQVSNVGQVNAWLIENNLSWQKGYPSQTECTEQQGLIPEMHDVLLNDPDVLR